MKHPKSQGACLRRNDEVVVCLLVQYKTPPTVRLYATAHSVEHCQKDKRRYAALSEALVTGDMRRYYEGCVDY